MKFAEESLQIYMIEVNENPRKDAASNGNSIVDKNYVVSIFAEWAMKRASLSTSYPGENETTSATTGRKESNVLSNGGDLSPVDPVPHREDARAAIYRALSADSSYSAGSSPKPSRTARSNEVAFRKMMINSKLSFNTSSSIPSARECGSPPKSSNGDAFAEIEPSQTTPKFMRKNGVKNGNEPRDKRIEEEAQKDLHWNPDNEGANIPSLELTLLSNGVYRTMTANSPKPIPFENDIFVGHLLLLVNTKPICEQYFKRFEGTAQLSVPCARMHRPCSTFD